MPSSPRPLAIASSAGRPENTEYRLADNTDWVRSGRQRQPGNRYSQSRQFPPRRQPNVRAESETGTWISPPSYPPVVSAIAGDGIFVKFGTIVIVCLTR